MFFAMETNSYKCLFKIFEIICVISAASMILYCSHEYSKNEDLSEVSYREFSAEDERIYPQLTMCVTDNTIETDVVKESGLIVDPSSFDGIYDGSVWNDIIHAMNMSKVKQRFKSNVIDSCLISGPPTTSSPRQCEGKGSVWSIINAWGDKCLSFHYRNPETIWEATVWIKNSKTFKRAREKPLGLYAVFTFPEQLFYMASIYKFEWPIRDNSSKSFAMSFILRNLEVMELRDKLQSRCLDWKRYDSIVMNKIAMKTAKCRPFYWEAKFLYPNCTTKEELAQIWKESNHTWMARKFLPCKKLQKLQMEFDEEDTDVSTESMMYDGIERSLKTLNSWFRVTLRFPERTYKNIKQTKAYTIQSLIGNAGGYLGLFVGYTISELPFLVLAICKKLKTLYSSFTIPQHNKTCSKLTPSSKVLPEESTVDDKMAKLEFTINELQREIKNMGISKSV